MPRAQCMVYRGDKVLLVRHRQDGAAWWCLPGGGIEAGEAPDAAALRELYEECGVRGEIVRPLATVDYAEHGGVTYTYLVDIGAQTVRLGHDPEFADREQILVGVAWRALHQIPERDRAFLWAAGLLGVPAFADEVAHWGEAVSYPDRDREKG